VSKIVIADSTCLIGLSKIGRLDVLRQLFGSIVIPPTVYHEVVVRGAGRFGTVAVLAKAVEKGFIEELQPVLEELRKAGFRFPVV
jgi:predicted nucleic acid-binding protein